MKKTSVLLFDRHPALVESIRDLLKTMFDTVVMVSDEDSLLEALDKLDPDLVVEEWRPLYDLAWTDFHRFVKGWSPGHWKIHNYSERKAREVVAGLKGGT